MSRALEFVVFLLLTTIAVGCGDKSGDDASSDAGSNDSSSDIDTASSDIDAGSSDPESQSSDIDAGVSDNDPAYSDIDASVSGDDPAYSDIDASVSGDDPAYSDIDASVSGDDPAYSDIDASVSGDDPAYSDIDASVSGDDPAYSDIDASVSGDDPAYSDIDGYGGESRKRAPKTYSERARAAFEQGNDELALKYTYAAILTNTELARSQKFHYWAGPKKPTMAIRWGVGIDFRAQKNLKSRPPLIGDKPNIPEREKRRPHVIGRKKNSDDGSEYDDGYDSTTEEYGDGGGGGPFRLPNDAWGQLVYLTGDVGERFLERLDMRRVRSYYGAVLKNAPKSARKSSRDGYSDDGSVEYYGDSYEDAEYYSEDEAHGEGRRAAPTPAQLIPGVTMLGVGDSKELLRLAKQQNLDVLLVFDVAYTTINPRSTIEKNELVMRLILVSTGNELCKSKPINNIAVWHAREDLRDEKNDPVDVAIDEILRDFADKHVRVSDLPPLDAEMAKARVSALTDKGKPSDPLPVLAEIKYYHTKGLLTNSELADAYKQVIGDVGLQLASASLEDQKKALAPYLEAAASEAESSPSGTGVGSDKFR